MADAHRERELLARKVSGLASEALSRSKRAIFALHRGTDAEAATLLKEADERFVACEEAAKKHKVTIDSGVYQAALEEYAEARLFAQYLANGKFGALEKRLMEPRVYLAALSDATGEAVRDAVRRASRGEVEIVAHALHVVEEAVEYLLSLDLTGDLRTKFDQAKKNLRSLEQMAYEVRLRDRSVES